ncbi:MAG: alpha/beta hydrolase [Coxiellaceae bacterium]|nr:MAG: alpha/beta hydrolase [Coxiellaceae bacterium]
MGLLLSTSISLAAQSPHYLTSNDINALLSKPADYRLFYGKDSLQFGDLRLPNTVSKPYPVAIIVHGGCWVSKFADLHYTAALADALRDSGIATWNIEYRRLDNSGGGWPGTFEDVGNAADFLRVIADKYSLDLNHVITVGESVGGQLALWLAARHRLPKNSQLYAVHPLNIKGVVVLGGVTDLKAFRKQSDFTCGSDVVGKLLNGSSSQIAAHYHETSPIELIPLGVPQILIYGADDKSVPKKFGETYMQAARKAGDNVELIIVPKAAHHEYVSPNSVTWPAVKSAVQALLPTK